MANRKKSGKKAARQTIRRTLVNVRRVSAVKTIMKKVQLAVEKKDIALASSLMKEAESSLAKACNKGTLKKNTAARLTGRLAKKVSQLKRSPSIIQ